MNRIFALLTCFVLCFSMILPVNAAAAKTKEKKISCEVSLGLGRINPQELYYRTNAIDTLVAQNASHYNTTITESGDFTENKMVVPIYFSLIYNLKDKLYLKADLEYGFSNSSSQKEFTLQWPQSQAGLTGINETQQFDISQGVSYIMPRVGAGYRIKPWLDAYAMVGLGFASMNHTEDFTNQFGSQPSQSSESKFKANGTAPGILLGLKYQLPIFKNNKSIKLFAKLEYLLFSAGSLSGSYTLDAGAGGNNTEVDGTAYSFNWNPYRRGDFQYWDILETEPTGQDKSNVSKMKLNLSAIRLMIGISF